MPKKYAVGIDDCLETTFASISYSLDHHDLIFFQYQHIDARSNPIYSSSYRDINLFVIKNIKNYISFPALIFDRSLYLTSGGMIHQHGNDFDLVVKLISMSRSFTIIDLIFSSFRIHRHSRTSNIAFRLADLSADLRVAYSHGALPINAYMLRWCYYIIRRLISYASTPFTYRPISSILWWLIIIRNLQY